MVQIFLAGDAVVSFLPLWQVLLWNSLLFSFWFWVSCFSSQVGLSGKWATLIFCFAREELWDNKQWTEVVFLNEHQTKIKAAVVCDLPGVPVPSEA